MTIRVSYRFVLIKGRNLKCAHQRRMWGWPRSPPASRLSGGCFPRILLVLEIENVSRPKLYGKKKLQGYFPVFYECRVFQSVFLHSAAQIQCKHLMIDTSSMVQEAN